MLVTRFRFFSQNCLIKVPKHQSFKIPTYLAREIDFNGLNTNVLRSRRHGGDVLRVTCGEPEEKKERELVQRQQGEEFVLRIAIEHNADLIENFDYGYERLRGEEQTICSI
jgi:hypothetical protein